MSKKKTVVAYGSVYLDTGEDVFDLTEKQIKSFVNQNSGAALKFVFWDIVGKKSQVSEVMAARAYVQQEIMAQMEMDLIQVYVATTFKDSQRPARDLMLEYVK